MNVKRIEPGLYEIEGIQVRRLQHTVQVGASRYHPWLIVWPERAQRVWSLREAKAAIAARTSR